MGKKEELRQWTRDKVMNGNSLFYCPSQTNKANARNCFYFYCRPKIEVLYSITVTVSLYDTYLKGAKGVAELYHLGYMVVIACILSEVRSIYGDSYQG
jgi:hypothetical protein